MRASFPLFASFLFLFSKVIRMSLSFWKKAALAAAMGFWAAGSALAADTVEVFYHPYVDKALDYGQMGYTNKKGKFIPLTGQQILGTRVEITFKPEAQHDLKVFHVDMVVPVSGSVSQYISVEGSQLTKIGSHKYQFELPSSTDYNGEIVAGRFSVDCYGLNENGEVVPMAGTLSAKSGFYFTVTKP